MNTLVLIPKTNSLEYAYFQNNNLNAVLEGRVHEPLILQKEDVMQRIFRESLYKIVHLQQSDSQIALRIPLGGDTFPHPTLLDNEVLERLTELIPYAPMQLSSITSFIEITRKYFDSIPIVLFFETSYFTKLPVWESRYGIASDEESLSSFRRYGFHGLFHQSAYRFASNTLPDKSMQSHKIISICMEPKPEITAVIDDRPVMLTSGCTLLEGLPGETSCGELDPSIVLNLYRDFDFGPEEINRILTQESGISALLEETISFEELFDKKKKKYKIVQEYVLYKTVSSIGTGMAAMNGIDGIVFSGQYSKAGKQLAAQIHEKMPMLQNIPFIYLSKNLTQVIAEDVFNKNVLDVVYC